MIAPLRGAIAAHCDMAEMDGSTANMEMPVFGEMAHDMSAMHSTGSMSSEMNQHSCCDDLSFNCSDACDLGVNVSLVLQEISYAPVYKASLKSVSLSSKILFRELTPPSRPPANFHS